LHSIKEFLIKLIKDKAVIDNINNSIRIDLKEKGMFLLSTNNIYLIEFVIIPLLDDLTWHTKKYLDYCDWKAIFNIKKLGLHYLAEGEYMIKRIVSQMNNNRLSTSKAPKIDRIELLLEIEKFLSRPSNYEIKDGKVWVLLDIGPSSYDLKAKFVLAHAFGLHIVYLKVMVK